MKYRLNTSAELLDAMKASEEIHALLMARAKAELLDQVKRLDAEFMAELPA